MSKLHRIFHYDSFSSSSSSSLFAQTGTPVARTYAAVRWRFSTGPYLSTPHRCISRPSVCSQIHYDSRKTICYTLVSVGGPFVYKTVSKNVAAATEVIIEA